MINELYQMIGSFSTKKTRPIFMTERKGDIRFSRLDHSKAIKLLNWKPTFDLNTGLRKTFKYYEMIFLKIVNNKLIRRGDKM